MKTIIACNIKRLTEIENCKPAHMTQLLTYISDIEAATRVSLNAIKATSAMIWLVNVMEYQRLLKTMALTSFCERKMA